MKGKNKKQENLQSKLSAKSASPGKWLPVLFFFLAFAVYSNTLSHQYSCDDGLYTYQNTFVQKGISSFPDLVTKGSEEGCPDSYVADYRPMVLVNLALEKSIFGGKPAIHHFFNVLLYSLLCGFLFRFLRRILNDCPVYVPALITVLFIVHPLHTEVVASIKSRDELLCLTFGLFALNYAYLFANHTGKIRYLIFGCVSFFLCLLSKESGYSFAALIPLVLYYFTNASLKKISLISLPFILVAALGIFIRFRILDSVLIDKPITIFENSLMAATSLADSLATNFTMLLHALSLLFFPLTLSWDYSFSQFPVVNWGDATPLLSLAIHLCLIGIAVIGAGKKNIFSFTVLFYLISYLITSNLAVKISSSFGERFLFVPSMAFCIALPFLAAKLFRIDLKKTSFRGASRLVTIILLVSLLYAFKTIDRNKDWKNNMTLYASGVETSPNSVRTHFSYANELRIQAETTTDPARKSEAAFEALGEFQKGLNIYSGDTNTANIYYNMGVLHFATGNNEDALMMYNKALILKPAYAEALNNAGVILFYKKDYAKALTYFKKATKSKPDYSEAFANLGACYQNLKEDKQAIPAYEKALQLNPANKNVLNNLSALYSYSGDTAKATYYRTQALNY